LVEEVFFGNSPIGHAIEDATPPGEIFASQSECDAPPGDDNFRFSMPNKAKGDVHIVYKQLRHMLANPEYLELQQRNGRSARALVPYGSDSTSVRSAVVVQFQDEEVVATREDASLLVYKDGSKTNPARDAENEPPDHEDEVLPLFGEWEGDMEDSDRETESTTEGLAPEAEDDADTSDLNENRAATIIDDFIQMRMTSWQQKMLEKEVNGDNTAWKVWKEIKKSVTLRALKIDGAKNMIDHFSSLLAKMKATLLVSTWRSDKSLEEACGALETTIDNREQQRWKISIWQRRQEPGHTVQHRSGKRSAAPHPTNHSKAEPSFVPDANDRLSYSPAPLPPTEEPQTEEEIVYEADDEEYHTPEGSPEAVLGAATDTEDPQEFVVDDDDGEQRGAMSTPDFDMEDAALPQAFDAPSEKESSYSPGSPSGTGDNDELPSPSKLVKFKVPSTPQTPIKTSGTPSVKKPSMFVDLSTITSSPSSKSSNPKKRGRPPTTVMTVGAPGSTPASEVDSWNYYELVKANDRQRLLILFLRKLGLQAREDLATLIGRFTRPKFIGSLLSSCRALQTPTLQIPDEAPTDDHTIRMARELYIRYLFPSSSEDEVTAPLQHMFSTILNSTQAQLFVSQLSNLASKTSLYSDAKTPSSKIGSSLAPVIISSSDERATNDATTQQRSSQNIRKKPVKRSTTAQQSRKAAAERERKFNESQTGDSSRLAAMVRSDPGDIKIEINPARDEGTDPIYISEDIASKMQGHQIDGVRFLWREIVTGEEKGQGCILAHTMGLGKTMQTITFLVTVNEVAQSEDRSISSQLPRHLRPKDIHNRQLRILIICPPALLQNWTVELNKWAPNRLGDTLTIESGNKINHLNDLANWMRFGGVVLIGYQMFSKKVKPAKADANKQHGNDFTEDADSARIREMLLNGPELVVADEAHYLKNEKSGYALAASTFKTESRIALTGTPMSNDVSEIYAIVSFVAPGFLGNAVEFRAHFSEPIQRGLYRDSEPSDKRKSTMRLQVLHKEIQPKINRKNIEVLRGSIKPKIEFVITLPLSNAQTELYKRTVSALLRKDGSEEASAVAIFGWLAVLTLLTNHPHCFRKKLMEPPKPRNGKKGEKGEKEDAEKSVCPDDGTPVPTESGTDSPSNVNPGAGDATALETEPDKQPMRALGFTEDMISSILDGFEDDSDRTLSAKVNIFFELLDHSLKCKDKVLVFSSSILTLDYLQQLLKQHEGRFRGFRRIDGQTPMKTRTKYLETFHEEDDVNILLISTRAGGLGLNIQGANRVFIFDFGFNPTNEEQAIGRAYRLGQPKPVFVYRFVMGGTFEMNIYNKQLFKSSLAQRVVDKKNPRRNAERTRDYLYMPKDVSQEPLQEWIGKDPYVLDKLLIQHGKRDTMIRKIKTMETLQEEELDAPLNEEEQKEVQNEIDQGWQRVRGRRPASAQAGMANGHASTQVPRRPSLFAANGHPPPPSTATGMNLGEAVRYNMGGLPLAKR
jgi:SNF2 family DNA or RNA helicase